MDSAVNVNPINQSPKKSPLIFRILLRVIIVFFILIILLITAGIIVSVYYQDEVKEYVVKELNKQLNTQIIIDGKDIDFTVIKNFPNASVDFKNVKVLDATDAKKKDTLFSAKEISLQFNIVDIFNKKYHIKRLEIDKATLKIRIDKNGKDNYHFWKQSTDTATSALSLELKDIELREIKFVYKDSKTKKNIDAFIKKSSVAGDFKAEKFSLETTTDMFVNTIKADNVVYLKKQNVVAKVFLNVDNSIKSYKIKDVKIKIEDLTFDVFGNIIYANNDPIVNLGIRGKDMDIKSILSLIPEKYKGKINDYESTGEFYLKATIQGSLANNQQPEIVADFGINKADITQVKQKMVMHNVTLTGHYTNGNKSKKQPSSLVLNPFTASIKNAVIAGDLRLTNLDNPSFSGKIKGELSMEDVQQFLKMDTIETVTGKLKIDATFSGEGKNVESGNYEDVTTSGILSITDMNMKLKNSTLSFNSINGDFNFDNNDLTINKFNGNAGSSDFDLKGSCRNIVGFIMKPNQDITIDATFNSKSIDLNEILANKDKTTRSEDKYKIKFSERINVNLNSNIQHLIFRKFEATNISGVIKYKDKKMVADPIVLSTMDGRISTSGLIDGTDSTKIVVTCFSDIDSISITKLFAEFENFGESTITDKNIKGIATAKIQFASVFNNELKMDARKLYSGIDMTIENGELNNVDAMKHLSRFISLKDLENIRFSTLKTQIEIKNQIINIPKTEVKSNAINLIVSGTQAFSGDIDYHIKLSLNQLLSKKAREAKKENDENGEVADDGLGRTNIYLAMKGTIDHPIIKYDSKSEVQNLKQDIKVEKQHLKAVLKDEFGLFKKDSTLKNKNSKVEENKFTIKWEEADKKEEKKELKKPKKPEEDDF